MTDTPEDIARLTELLSDRHWRLNNLYKILDPHGKTVPFKMNWAQEDYYRNMHYFDIILKARQLGFSTFILIYMLDAALFNSNQTCGVIAHDLDSTKDLFDNKVKFAYDNLPEWLKAERPLVSDSARKLEFSNGSSITVGTSLRGGTYQKLHISELGKISARYPEKAREIKTGALNTVHAGQQIFIESTAEGQSGEFFDLVQLSRKLGDMGVELSNIDPKFHFYPWYEHPGYTLSDNDAKTTIITKEFLEYFDSLPVDLSLGQKAWYVKKAAIQGEDMKREYPSTPEESFETSLEGVIYQKQMVAIRKAKQITRVPYERSCVVDTFWDMGHSGMSDYISIWFFQHVGMEYRFIRYIQATGMDLEWYANELKSFRYVYGNHYLPHDGARTQLGFKNKTIKETMEGIGIRPITIVPRTPSLWNSIKTKCRMVLPRCWFDAELCAEGIICLDSYRKQWNDQLGVWRDEPRHDEFSHGADAFRTFAEGYQGRQAELDDDFDTVEVYSDQTRSSVSGY
jgi:hypothetical protein